MVFLFKKKIITLKLNSFGIYYIVQSFDFEKPLELLDEYKIEEILLAIK